MTTTSQLSGSIHVATPHISVRGVKLVRAADALWRVHSAARIIGHLRLLDTPLGPRYRAERLHLPSGTFRVVGEFWSADDAVAALEG